jgi:hypothetical protein
MSIYFWYNINIYFIPLLLFLHEQAPVWLSFYLHFSNSQMILLSQIMSCPHHLLSLCFPCLHLCRYSIYYTHSSFYIIFLLHCLDIYCKLTDSILLNYINSYHLLNLSQSHYILCTTCIIKSDSEPT